MNWQERRTCRGFTLLEVMVATAIVGVSFGAVCCLLAQSARVADVTGKYARAALLAESKLEELTLGDERLEQPQRGAFEHAPGFTWALKTRPAEDGGKGLVRLSLTVAFTAPGGERQVLLETLQADRTLPKTQEQQKE